MQKWKGCLLALLFTLTLCGSGVVLAETTQQAQQPQAQSSDRMPTRLPIPLAEIQRFATAIALIKHYYIEKVEDHKLFDNAIEGLLANLDPHSAYLNKDALADLRTATTGQFGGVGIEVMPQDGFIRVISPLEDTPADKAGIKANDLIVRINNKIVKKLTMQEAVNMMRGEPGTKVSLTVVRKGEKKPLIFNITRRVIKIKTIKAKLLEKGYAYVRITIFQVPVERELESNILQLQAKSGGKLKGLIIDVRNNPGGLLDAAVEVADKFLDSRTLGKNKLIVYTKGRFKKTNIRATATPGAMLKGVPIVVLVNGGSASASEIVAGALQDHKRAVVLGTRSFGKGSVQTVLPIDKNSAMKLTTALYYTPIGRSIQAQGIVPDVIVANLAVTKKDEDVLLDPVKEADLIDHISSELDTKITESTKRSIESEQKLAHEDFQLYEALQLLKGVNALKSIHAPVNSNGTTAKPQ